MYTPLERYLEKQFDPAALRAIKIRKTEKTGRLGRFYNFSATFWE